MVHLLLSYFTTGWRNLLRHKIYAAINILGLALGMACCLLIFLFIQDEFRYGHYHSNAARIYRVLRKTEVPDGRVDVSTRTRGPLRGILLNEFPEVEKAMRGLRWGMWIRIGDKTLGKSFTLADEEILDLFDISLISGTAETALSQPYSILISQQAARDYFGDEEPVGKIATVLQEHFAGDYVITGVMKNQPDYAFFTPDFLTAQPPLASSHYRGLWEEWGEWTTGPFENWILLAEGHSPRDVEQKLTQLLTPRFGAELAPYTRYYLQSLERIHLYSFEDFGLHRRGNINFVYQLAALASFILLIACANFINLTTARSTRRAREVGIRKTIGGRRSQLIQQFLGESLLLVLLSLLLALFILELVLPHFNSYMGKNLSLWSTGGPYIYLSIGVAALFIALLAGIYPAFVLSAYHPIYVLKGAWHSGRRRSALRRGLVIFQFALCTILLVGAAVVHQQIAYIHNKNIGFQKKNMAVLPIFMFDAELRLQERFEEVKNAFLAHPQVLSATVCWPDPTWEPKRVLVQKAGGTRMDLEMELITADHDFLETFGMELVSGRNFMPEVANELKVPIILNETAVRQLGWQNAIGKPFSPYPNMQGQVIGVVKDFHTLAFHEKIQPLMLLPGGHMMIALRMAPENRSGTVAFLKQTWEELSSNPFQIRFVEDILDNRYEAEALLSTACTVFSAFSVFVGILGLVGLTSYNVEQRIKEVAIRKAFGAGMGDILTLLSNECLQSVLLASVIGWVCAYYFMDQWLQGFAYRIDLGLAVFPLCGLVILSIALLAVGTLVLRATMRNPVEFLRNE